MLDIGACYGVNMLLVRSEGRDVIALDNTLGNLSELFHRVEKHAVEHSKEGVHDLGNLVGCVPGRLPNRQAVASGSVSGVLVSGVLVSRVPPYS